MSVTIAMPRMVPNQLLAEAHAKYPESLARAGAEMRWIELDDPEKAVQDALACDGLIIERYKRRKCSVEEALIEMYLAGVSVRRVEDITELL